jgi:hypothetical protein
MNMIHLPRVPSHATAWANDQGLWLEAGWTVGIPPDVAVQYLERFDTDPSRGFFRSEGKIVLSQGGAKIALFESEVTTIIQLIRAAFSTGCQRQEAP